MIKTANAMPTPKITLNAVAEGRVATITLFPPMTLVTATVNEAKIDVVSTGPTALPIFLRVWLNP